MAASSGKISRDVNGFAGSSCSTTNLLGDDAPRDSLIDERRPLPSAGRGSLRHGIMLGQ
jgi:hypothetical protein